MPSRDSACLSVCTRCRAPDFTWGELTRPGYRLAEMLARDADPLAEPFRLRGISCMSQCKRPCVVALSAPAKFTLLFGDLNPETDPAAIRALARQYADSTDGIVARADRPACLRAGILGRIPPFDYTGDLLVPELSQPTIKTKGPLQ